MPKTITFTAFDYVNRVQGVQCQHEQAYTARTCTHVGDERGNLMFFATLPKHYITMCDVPCIGCRRQAEWQHYYIIHVVQTPDVKEVSSAAHDTGQTTSFSCAAAGDSR